LPTVLTPAGQLVIPRVSAGVGSIIDDLSSLGSGEDDENISLVWEDSKVERVGNALVCWEDDTGTLEVEPLAMSKPVETGLSEGIPVIQDHGGVVTPFDWVLGKSKHIGKVLVHLIMGMRSKLIVYSWKLMGDVLNLLMRWGVVKITKDGRTGNRELK
jgi:hypothetical protein